MERLYLSVLEDAISRGDLEVIYAIWKEARFSGRKELFQEVNNTINENVLELAEYNQLKATTFNELMRLHDQRIITSLVAYAKQTKNFRLLTEYAAHIGSNRAYLLAQNISLFLQLKR